MRSASVFLVAVIGPNQPKISRHLAYLRRAGLVRARRDGKWIHYSVTHPSDPNAAKIFGEVLSWLKEDDEMSRDRQTLAKVCCAPQLPAQLASAPRPITLTQSTG